MNCTNCGAENEAEARFCAECGTPLDDVVVETAKAEQVFNETDQDATIMSAPGEIAMEAKTLAVGQTNMTADMEDTGNAEEVVDDSPPAPEAPPSPSDPSPDAGDGGNKNGGNMDNGDSGDGRGSNRTMIIVGVTVLVILLLCCCCSVLVGGVFGSDPGLIEDLIEEIATLPAFLALV